VNVSLGNTSVSGFLNVASDSSFNGNVIIDKNLSVKGNVSLGNTSVSGNLFVGFDSSFNGNVVVNKNLSVRGNISLGTASGFLNVVSDSSFNGNVIINKNFTTFGNVSLGNTSVSGNLFVSFDSSFNGNVVMNKNLTIRGNSILYGNVSIGKNLALFSLDISGDLNVSDTVYAGRFVNTSDYRIKQNPVLLDESYNVDRLRPLRYKNLLIDKDDLGFIAHEVQEVYPFLVSGNKDEEKKQSLNYIGLIAILVKEIQELKKENVIIKEKSEKFENRLQFLEMSLLKK
jgi:cytoskeletal protein CcmA (bactofilin family)